MTISKRPVEPILSGPSAEEVAASWRQATPAAVHPELDAQGRPKSNGSALNTITQLLAGINDHLPPRAKADTLLDYGGGPGRVARLALPYFDRVIVADTNPAYLRIASKAGAEILQVSPLPVALPPSDVLLCVNLFLHLPVDTALALLALFASSTRLVALQLPIYDVAVPPATWTSVGTWTLEGLEYAAGLAGLKILEAHSNPGRYDGIPGPNHARLHFLDAV